VTGSSQKGIPSKHHEGCLLVDRRGGLQPKGLPEREKTVGKGPKKRNAAPAGGHHPGTGVKLCPSKNATETENSGCEGKSMGSAAGNR
jgi:hypothetical protein